MASKQLLAAVAASMALVFLPTLASATDHVVGDSQGWTLGFDYAAWAESKQFTVGDTLGTRSWIKSLICTISLPCSLELSAAYF
jgi:hypothetical protein